MKRCWAWRLGSLAATATALAAQAALATAAQPGAALYVACSACHGADGEGNPALNAPALGGQDASYLARQLRNFQSGARGANAADAYGAQMRGMAATLADDAAIAAVAAHASALPGAPTQPRAYNQRNGANHYHAACGGCHGDRAQGNPLLRAPRLAGQDERYLRRQMAHFRDGLRGAAAGDRPGRQMAMMATMVTAEQDLDDVLGYILAQ